MKHFKNSKWLVPKGSYKICPMCGGTGKWWPPNEKCPKCKGKGEVLETKSYFERKGLQVNDSVRESLSSYAHNAWSEWIKYLFEKATLNPDGTATIPRWAVDRWMRQMNTQYIDLPENEKESDQTEADRILSLVYK